MVGKQRSVEKVEAPSPSAGGAGGLPAEAANTPDVRYDPIVPPWHVRHKRLLAGTAAAALGIGAIAYVYYEIWLTRALDGIMVSRPALAPATPVVAPPVVATPSVAEPRKPEPRKAEPRPEPARPIVSRPAPAPAPAAAPAPTAAVPAQPAGPRGPGVTHTQRAPAAAAAAAPAAAPAPARAAPGECTPGVEALGLCKAAK